MKKIAFHTLGCKLNFSETSSISNLVASKDYAIVDFKDNADFYVVNTCLVTSAAERKSKAAIKQAHQRNPKAAIIVIGCMSQLKAEEIKKVPGVKYILDNEAKFRLTDYLSLKEQAEPLIAKNDILSNSSFVSSYSINDRTRSFLKIQDGCDYYCSYCTVPYARGHSRSDSIDHVLENANKIIQKGTKEIVLTGVNIGDFGKKNDETLYKLLLKLETIKGIQRIRISSIEPDLLSNSIIEHIANSKKILPHFHLPLQSACNKTLKEMGRRYTVELFSQRIEKIKQLMPHCCIAADVIVGFPNESDKDFEETYRYIQQSKVSYVHVFTYSDRPLARSSQMKEKISGECKHERSKKLHLLSEMKKKEFYIQNIGRTANVLFESDISKGYISGFTENYIKVKTLAQAKYINQIIPVTLELIDRDGMFII